MQFDPIITLLKNTFRELITTLQAGDPIPALGLPRSVRLPFLTALLQSVDQPIILLTDRFDHALSTMEEMALWSPNLKRLIFSEPSALFYEKSGWGETSRRERLVVLGTLANYHLPSPYTPEDHPIIIVPARGLMTRTLPRRDFLIATKQILSGQIIKPEELITRWIEIGYQRVNSVIAPGHFARRGGILDIWPIADSYPVRIDYFGDQIESLKPFEPATQRTYNLPNHSTPARLIVSPAREVIVPLHVLEENEAHGEHITEFHLPYYHNSPASLLDYLPKKSLVLIDDYQAFQDTVIEQEEQGLELRKAAIRDGILPEDYPSPYLSWSELLDSLHEHQFVELGSMQKSDTDSCELYSPARWFSPGKRFAGQLRPFFEHLLQIRNRGEDVYIVSRQKSRLEELWREQISTYQSQWVSGENEDHGLATFIQGSLADGWSFSPDHGNPIHLLTDSEIFGMRPPEPRQRRHVNNTDPESAYADYQPGDWVVHIDHGVGIFVGLVSRTMEGMEREYLCVEYANDAQLFVPVYQADRLTRYVGPDKRTPSMSHLGGIEWRSAKTEAKEAVQAVAEDLLELYAKRSIIDGYTFSSDTHWQEELEASFPYIETDDQIRVLKEVKTDMESPRPMDRLICGDVGYGKTEVALRAAFKSVVDGKQVAVLVPTTVLAQQHYDTFQQRLAAFPVEVEMLSRFRTPQQQQNIVERLGNGTVDIVIGTHRLFSSDVFFKDLGLLIIDEEQRFGVTHKERLKKMRTEVDVLALTATPIPRTLYMALAGVRDISTINTPPEERLPIKTYVGPYSPDIVRKAVLRELERGGQIFFVHNRVQTIGAIQHHLEKLIPEARIAVVHGQMAEHELSQRMKLFTGGEVDILLSTSIIESGLDIPNANTLIVDRADMFGLAQLYQLRGRVGRGSQRAYAYFFKHRKKHPTEEGQQRLETIAENTQLGAGYTIAMRDLEIRGTGDILGTRQSGHVAAVGFHLYTRLLAGAVRRMRISKENYSDITTEYQSDGFQPVHVDLPFAVNIPSSYVQEKGMRLRLYRRIASVNKLNEVVALRDEFFDRFGELPEPTSNLLFQLKIKILAVAARLSSVSIENGQIVLRYGDKEQPPSPPDLNRIARVGKNAIWIPYSALEDWQSVLCETLITLGKYHTEHNLSALLQ